MVKYLVTWKGVTKEIEANSEFDAQVRATHIFPSHTTSDSIGLIRVVEKFDDMKRSDEMERGYEKP